MAIESKFHRPPPVDHVLVSEATRRDAQPVSPPRFETYEEERDDWIHKKRQIESELSGYTATAFAGMQAKIRREHLRDPDASFKAWISTKASMEQKRQVLIQKKAHIENEIMRLKPLVKVEKARKFAAQKERSCPVGGAFCLEDFSLFRKDGSLSWNGVAAELLLEMRAIRRLLEHSPATMIVGEGELRKLTED
uniref:Uncharacterized protein n=1 Tax=viral metagenome TaxID=1070528 RepID=A0A6H1ZNX0_9ZZZZ